MLYKQHSHWEWGEREKERGRREGRVEKGGRERKKKEQERESVSVQSTHCLMFCSSARNKESKSCPDSTPAVIPTPFDVEPRKKSGVEM